MAVPASPVAGGADAQVGSLVVRILSDISQFVPGMRSVVDTVNSVAAEVARASRDIIAFTGHLQHLGNMLKSAFHGVGIQGMFANLFKSYDEQSRAEIRLKAAIEANGREASVLTQRYAAVAAQIRQLTVFNDRHTMGLFAMAEAHGISGNAAERTVRNAIALSSMKGGDPSSFIRQMAALESGNVDQQLLRLLPTLRHYTDSTARANAAQELLNRMFSLSVAEANTVGGQFKQLRNDLANLTAELGGIAAGWIMPIVRSIRDLISWFRALPPEMKQAIVAITLLVSSLAVMGAMVKTSAFQVFVTLFNVLGVQASILGFIVYGLARDFGGLGQAWVAIRDSGVKLWNDVTDALRAFIAWGQPIWQAFGDVVYEVWSGIREIITITLTTIRDTANAVWSAITGDAEINWDLVRQSIVDILHWIELAIRNVGEVLRAIGSVIADAFLAVYEPVKSVISGIIDSVFSLISANEDLATGYIVAEVALKALLITYILLRVTGVTNLAWIVLSTTALWAYTASVYALVAIKAVLIGLFVVLKLTYAAAWAILVGKVLTVIAMTVATAALNLAVLAITAAKTVWTAVTSALTVANILATITTIALQAAVVALAAVIIGVLIGAFAALVALVVGTVVAAFMMAWEAVTAFLEGLGQLTRAIGGLTQLGAIFSEIGGILKDVARAMNTDMALAWELLIAGGELALEHLKAIWPPFWEFLKKGFAAVWEYVSGVFDDFWNIIDAKINRIRIEWNPLATDADKEMARNAEQEAIRVAGLHRDALGEQMGRRIAAAAAEFRVTETPGVVAARQRVAEIRGRITETGAQSLDRQDLVQESHQLGSSIGSSFVDGFAKEMKKFDAVLAGSAEALFRLNQYRAQFNKPVHVLPNVDFGRITAPLAPAFAGAVAPAGAVGGAEAVARGGGGDGMRVTNPEWTIYLRRIADAIDRPGARPAPPAPAEAGLR